MNLDAMREMLIANEGLSLKVYKCTAGANSIGVGRNLDSLGISEDEAMLMLNNDIEICIAALDKRYSLWQRLSEARQLGLLYTASAIACRCKSAMSVSLPKTGSKYSKRLVKSFK